MPTSCTGDGCWDSTSRPSRTPTAGSSAMRTPNADWVMCRRASRSSAYCSTGYSSASPAAAARTPRVRCPAACGMPGTAAVSAATGTVTDSADSPVCRSPTCWVSTMKAAQPTAPRPANSTPAGSISPCQGSVRARTPSSASAGHSRARARWLRRAATVRGPRNSMATAVPSGMRAIAARKQMVTSPLTTPSPSRAGRSRRLIERQAGRATARKSRAPKLRRSQAVPAAPTCSISWTDSADPSCTESIAATARVHGGTALLLVDGVPVTTVRSGARRLGHRSRVG